MKNKIIIKLLDNEILICKNKKIYKEQTDYYINNNYIYNYKILIKELTNIIKKYKLSNMFIQNKMYILINRLYCQTNLLVIKIVMNEIGFSNYKVVYEEDLYNNLYKNILSIWNNKGILIKNNNEYYIDLTNKKEHKNIPENTLLITNNEDISKIIKKDLIIYEDTNYPIFNMMYK